ncbi:MAG: amidase family protein [Acetobacteraceae bacterium]
MTGGSSSASGVSVAARFNYMALGSDTGGSIRLPAAAVRRDRHQADADPACHATA